MRTAIFACSNTALLYRKNGIHPCTPNNSPCSLARTVQEEETQSPFVTTCYLVDRLAQRQHNVDGKSGTVPSCPILEAIDACTNVAKEQRNMTRKKASSIPLCILPRCAKKCTCVRSEHDVMDRNDSHLCVLSVCHSLPYTQLLRAERRSEQGLQLILLLPRTPLPEGCSTSLCPCMPPLQRITAHLAPSNLSSRLRQ